MKLDPKGVEKAAIAVSLTEDPMLPFAEQYRALTRVALTAYFDHLKSEGLMREARYAVMPKGDWIACEAYTNDEGFDTFPALILRMEAAL